MAKFSEHGFDLTDFRSAKNFEALLKQHKLSRGRRVTSGGRGFRLKQFVFKNKGLQLITANNPLTGEYAYKQQRPIDKGYASYIGIKGQPSLVKRLVLSIKKRARRGIKGESVGRREFI